MKSAIYDEKKELQVMLDAFIKLDMYLRKKTH